IKDPSINERFQALMKKKNVQSREEAKKLQISFIKGLQRNMVNRIKREEQAKVRKGARGRAIEELVEEKLKLQEAKRLNLLVDDAAVDKTLTNIASKNKMDLKQFATHLNRIGTDISSMRSRFKSMMSWQGVVRRRFGFQVAMLTRDVDRFMDRAAAANGDVDLKVQRITLPMSSSANQGAMAQQLQLADQARSEFKGCASTAAVAQRLPGAKFEDLGTLKSSAVAEPTRSMLLGANDGDMLPPSLQGSDGIQLWVVCGRNTVALETKKRFKEQGELRQEEFGILARKHLKDLRQDATIVYR
nr:SurA N-terminal domain-containing protein [Alphaproteobacteria bacterium]